MTFRSRHAPRAVRGLSRHPIIGTSILRIAPPSRLRHGDRACYLFSLAGLALLLLAGPALAAEAPEIVVEAGADEIYIGETIDYAVEIRNIKNPPAPELSALREDFDVAANGDESRDQSSVFIINGRKTEQRILSHVYRFRLTPKRTGNLTIPAPTATIDGKTVSGRALALNVIAPEEQDVVIPEMTTDRSKVYPTQPFEVTLRVLVRPLPDKPDSDPLSPLRQRPPHIGVNWVDLPSGLTGEEKARWLEKLLSRKGSGFTLNDVTMSSGAFFEGPRAAVFDLYTGREKRKALDGRMVDYFVYELKRAFTPERAGTHSLGPAIIKGMFVEGMEGRRYTGRKLVAIAPALTLEVREVPSPRPATFCGGIGKYRVAASASPTDLRVGDPLTLTLEIERQPGSGSLELISAPDISADSELTANFEIVDRNPTGRTEGERKRFAYALRPKHAGSTIPALAVTVFNPDSEKFTDIATRPITLAVAEASHVGAGELVGSIAGSGATEIKSREQGIFQNISDPSELRDQTVNVALLTEVAAGTWCAVGCLFAIVSSRRRRSGDVGWQRQRQARSAARQKLSHARAALVGGQSMEALRAIRSAVLGLIADMRNIIAEGLTAADADAALALAAVPSEARGEVKHLLEAVESAEYGSGGATQAAEMIDTAENLIPRLARHLERNG